MTGRHAFAVRRLALFTGALVATLGAHALASGELSLVPAAPLAWGSLAALTVLAGRPRAPEWRPRSAGGILARLTVLQAALHCAMTGAPWAFGLAVHHRPALVTPLALVAHGAAALVLTALLARAERLLHLAQCVVRAVRAALAPAPARSRHHAIAPAARRAAPRGPGPRRVRARGPPAAPV